jgi:hypothetical protein
MAALNRIILLKKLHHQLKSKGKGYTFEAFIYDYLENDGSRRKRR